MDRDKMASLAGKGLPAVKSVLVFRIRAGHGGRRVVRVIGTRIKGGEDGLDAKLGSNRGGLGLLRAGVAC